MPALICPRFSDKLHFLLGQYRDVVNTKAKVARYCNVEPQTVNFWCNSESLTLHRVSQLEELFCQKPGTLMLSWEKFIEQFTPPSPIDPWKRLVIDADAHSILEICRKEITPPSRIIPESEPDDEPEECYRRGEKIYLKMELPNALLWAKHSVVLVKFGDQVRTVCPSEFCPDTDIVEPRFTLPRNIEGDVFKTSSDGLQSLITLITANPLPDNICQSLHIESNNVSEDTLRRLAVEVKSRPEKDRHVYRRDYRVIYS